MTSLPSEIFDIVEFTPLEDISLYLLRDGLPDAIRVNSLVEDDQQFPLVLVRRSSDWGFWGGDERFVDNGQLTVHVYCEGLEADKDCALLSEAVRILLRDSVNRVVPDMGYLTKAKMIGSPMKAPDWATATGPVQYADLPAGTVRYESNYELSLKKPSST